MSEIQTRTAYQLYTALTIEDLLQHHAEVKMRPAYAPFK
jgi:hypothetical protein